MGSAPGSRSEGGPWCCCPLSSAALPWCPPPPPPRSSPRAHTEIAASAQRAPAAVSPPVPAPCLSVFPDGARPQLPCLGSCFHPASTRPSLPSLWLPLCARLRAHGELWGREQVPKFRAGGELRCVTAAHGQNGACRGRHGVPQAPLSSPAGLCTWLSAQRGAGRQGVRRGSSRRQGSPSEAA